MDVQYNGEHRPIRVKESQNINFMRLSEQFLEFVSVHKEEKQAKLYIYFPL
jgi:hypothetical protein